MGKYLIFAFGDFTDSAVTTYITDCVSDITSSKYLKFVNNGNSMVLHFSSDMEFYELKKYVYASLESCTTSYFLVEHTDRVHFDIQEPEYLLNLDEWPKNNKKRNEKKITHDDDITHDGDIYQPTHSNRKHNLDNILDKIRERGLTSLTKSENKYLKSFSNNSQ